MPPRKIASFYLSIIFERSGMAASVFRNIRQERSHYRQEKRLFRQIPSFSWATRCEKIVYVAQDWKISVCLGPPHPLWKWSKNWLSWKVSAGGFLERGIEWLCPFFEIRPLNQKLNMGDFFRYWFVTSHVISCAYLLSVYSVFKAYTPLYGSCLGAEIQNPFNLAQHYPTKDACDLFHKA